MRAVAGHSLIRFLRGRRGSVLVEYGLIIGVIVIALVAVTMTGGGIATLFERAIGLLAGS